MYFPKGFNIQESIKVANLVALAYEQFEYFEKDTPWNLPESLTLVSILTYADSTPNPMDKKSIEINNYMKKKIFKTRNVEIPIGFIALDGNTVFVIFRGTQTADEWVHNLNTKLRKHFLPDCGNVHEGFYSTYMGFREFLLTAIKSCKNSKIIIGGHSLGAAFATLAISDIEKNTQHTVKALYTYGSPRVGDKDFSERYNREYGKKTFRIVNTSDVVTSIPFPIPFGSLVGGYFSHVDTPVDFTIQHNDIEENHSIHTYVDELNKSKNRGSLLKRFFSFLLVLFCAGSLFSMDIQNDIVQKAENYIGSSYLTGGTKPPQFDCSGFVGFILRPYVPGLPRMSKDIADTGKKISKEELMPGDLVFFATTPVPNVVSHVALYIGQNSIIHAISDGPDRGVNITPLNARYWKNHYHSAVRVLPNIQKTPAQEREVDVTAKAVKFAKGSYTGDLQNSEPNGNGSLVFNNGDSYSGAFVKGKLQGKGIYRWADGSKFEGEFKNDIFWGNGILTDIHGKKIAVVYTNGKFIPVNEKKEAIPSAKVITKENYIQKEDSAWDTWNGYVAGDYAEWKKQEEKKFDSFKNEYDKNKESKAFDEWKKNN